VIVVALLVALMVQQPRSDTILLSVQLVGVRSAVMEASLDSDSSLSLPTTDLSALLGIELPRARWTPLDVLQAQYRSLRITVSLRALSVWIEDDFETLPATRAMRDQQRRQAERAPVIYPSGPSVALSVDDRGATLTEAGYSFQGRAFAQVRTGSLFPRPASLVQRGTTSWALSVIPTPALFLAYSDGDYQRPTVTARLSTGPTWLSASWTPEHYVVDGLLTVGRLSFFASSRNSYSITLRAPVAVQLGRTGRTTTARVSVGPVFPSPFSPPTIP